MFNILRRHQTAYAYALGFIGVLCFAATLPLTTIALIDFSPTFITMIRAVIAATAACIWIIFSHSTRPTREEVKPLLVSGLGLVFLQ